MKCKFRIRKLFSIALVLSMVFLQVIPAFANTSHQENLNNTYDGSKYHTVTLRRIEPISYSDSYAWEIESEIGQLGQSLNALGLYSRDPNSLNEMLGADSNIICYPQDSIDLEQICTKFDLDYDKLSSENLITISYTEDDIKFSSSALIKSSDSANESDIERTTGSFSETLGADESCTTDPEEKDDDEQNAYLTLTTLSPRAYPEFNGIMARVLEYDSEIAVTAWCTFMSIGKDVLSYRTFEGEAGTEYCLEISNPNDRDIDVAGRWTP